MKKAAAEYLRAPYAKVLIPNDDGSFSAEVLEFTGCFAQGDTADEAIKNLDAAALEWIEAALAQGREIPEPSTTRGYSGTVSLRIPRGLHRQAVRMAEREGVSLNQYLLTSISARVGADDLFNRTCHVLAARAMTPTIAFNIPMAITIAFGKVSEQTELRPADSGGNSRRLIFPVLGEAVGVR
jgi:antitoxin HicB